MIIRIQYDDEPDFTRLFAELKSKSELRGVTEKNSQKREAEVDIAISKDELKHICSTGCKITIISEH